MTHREEHKATGVQKRKEKEKYLESATWRKGGKIFLYARDLRDLVTRKKVLVFGMLKFAVRNKWSVSLLAPLGQSPYATLWHCGVLL